MEQILRTEHLTNGVRVDFVDGSNRYFGDYHRLKIEIRCRIAITPQLFTAAVDPRAEADRVRRLLGGEIIWRRQLERMGVAGGDLEKIRREMMESFIKSSIPYLQSPQFPARLVLLEMAERRRQHQSFRLVK